MRLSSFQVEGVERSLDALSMRHSAIASNIANINTPNYARQEVNFEQSLIDALAQTQVPPSGDANTFLGGETSIDGMPITSQAPNVMLSWQPQMTKGAQGAQRVDGNQTTVETEMSGMAYNAVKYNALASFVAKEFQMLKSVAQAK